jgi:hypothetical protein
MCFNKSHLRLLTILLLLPGCHEDTRQAGDSEAALTTGPVYVTPDDDLQKALDQAAGLSKNRTLILRPGRYQSASPKFCLLAVTARHNGVVIAGEKGVVLSGRNALDAEVATVAHVIYCGDGVDNTTVIKDLRIEGGMGVSTNVSVPVENFGERARVLKQGLFFLMDGGAVKVFGKSSPCCFDIVNFVTTDVRPQDPRSMYCRAAPLKSKTACSWATLPTMEWMKSNDSTNCHTNQSTVQEH